MALIERIETLLVGNATGLVNSFKEGGTAAEGLQGKTTTAGKAMEALGLKGKTTGDMLSTGLKVGAAAGGLALAKFALDGVQHFSDMTATVRGFQRVIGGSAEDSSRLAAATQRMGIDAGTAQTAFGQLAKKIGENKDTLRQWGVEIARNKDGSVNFAKTLENISDKYVSIKDPAQRAAFASEQFGKGFMSINSLLGQGSENLQKFYDIAAAHHQIFSQDDLQKGLDFSRAMKDLQSAISGVGLELGRGLIPLLTGAATEMTTLVEVLDEFAGSGEGAALAVTALATGIAAAFGGPVWATAVAAITAVTIALGDNAAAAKVTADAEKKLGDELDLVSKKNAAKVFDDYVAKAAKFVPAVDSAAGRLKIFRGVSEESAAAGQKLIDSWNAQGIATGAYSKALADVIAKDKEKAANSAASKAANDALTGSTNQSTGAIKLQTAAMKEQLGALKAVQDALLGSQGGEIARQQAVIAATEAQNAYNDAVAQYGPDSTQARDASLALQSARLQETSATIDAKKKLDDFDVALSDPAAANAEIGQLQSLINKYGDADGALQAQIDKIHIYQFVAASTPQQVVTEFVASTEQALSAVGALQSALASLPTHQTVFLDVVPTSSGNVGIVGAIG